MYDNIKIVSQDIDGCLNLSGDKSLPLFDKDFTSNEERLLSEISNKIEISSLKEVIFNTGRSLGHTEFIVRKINERESPKIRYILCQNGGECFDLLENKGLTMTDLCQKTGMKLMEEFYFKEQNKIGCLIEYLKSGGESELEEYLSSYFSLEKKEGIFWIHYNKNSLSLFCPEEVDKSILLEKVKFFFSMKKWAYPGELVYQPSVFCLDINSHISKGTGLKVLLAYLNHSPQSTVHIGDGENDISAMTVTSKAFCPNNSVDIVKTICHLKGKVFEMSYGSSISHFYGEVK